MWICFATSFYKIICYRKKSFYLNYVNPQKTQTTDQRKRIDAIASTYLLFMRIVFEIPGDHVKTTVFHWNQKYLIKLEMAMYEQTYKVSEWDVSGDDDIRKLVEEETFKAEYMERFQQMHGGLHAALERIDV